MKFLYLLGSRLSLYFRKSRLFFLLFCFCGIATTISFLFFYASLPTVSNRKSERGEYKWFYVNDILSGLSEDALIDLAADPMVNFVTLTHTGISGVPMTISTIVDETPYFKTLMGKGSFEKAGPYSIIVPHFNNLGPGGLEARVGETVLIDGKEFKVIGTIAGLGDAYIPLATYLEMGLSTEKSDVGAAKRADVDSGAMEAKLREVFGENVSITQYNVREYDAYFSKEYFKNLSATYVVVILVFLFLFLQMVDGAGRETAIFRTFGATGVRILLMHFCEVILLTGLSTLAGCLLHAALYKPFFSKLNTVDIPYYFGDYVIVFAVIIGITLAASVPYVIRCLFLSPKEATLTAAQ